MKILSTFYWISLAICWFHLALYVATPVGPGAMYVFVKIGLYDISSGINHYSLTFPPYSENPATPGLILVNRAMGLLYLLTLFASPIPPFLKRVNPRTRYYIGISLGVTSLFIFFIVRRIWRYFVFVYLGI